PRIGGPASNLIIQLTECRILPTDSCKLYCHEQDDDGNEAHQDELSHRLPSGEHPRDPNSATARSCLHVKLSAGGTELVNQNWRSQRAEIRRTLTSLGS